MSNSGDILSGCAYCLGKVPMKGIYMFKKIKTLSLLMCSSLILVACHSDDDLLLTADAPKQVININSGVYASLRSASEDANALFASLGATNIGDELCDVKVHRMSYDTVGGAGEAATSSGVFMLPHGDDPACSGPRPVLLYAHGTSTFRDYDLSQFVTNPSNNASREAALLLAAYASKGYAVIAPNYAGYSDSSLSYHPYHDEVQQSTEMMDALDHVRTYADILGADLSSKLFISGLSQGGYVAMATHKALEARGDTVTASMPVSGPYAMLEFVDTIFAGYVNGGATTFGPMFLTALQMSDAIYGDPSEVYSAKYASFAENSLPRTGGFDDSGLPVSALFSGEPPEGANAVNIIGFDDEDYLLSDSFRRAYLSDLLTNGDSPVNVVRALVKDRDMRDWQPGSPMYMCGASTDPIVYYNNTTTMATYWEENPNVSSVDLAEAMAALPISEVHEQTSVYCAGAGLQYFAAFM